MFAAIFGFELRLGFKRPMIYIFFGLFLALSMVIGFEQVGLFNTFEGDHSTIANSAYSVSSLLVALNGNVFGLLNSIVLVSIMATAIQKDYEYNTHALFFTKPISKAGYFFGRFLAALVLGIFVMSGYLIGYFIGLLPGMGKPVVGAFELMNFLQPFLLFTLPNVFFIGIVLFALTTFTRKTLTAYLFCIILLILRSIAEAMSADLDKKTLSAIIEPFGSIAFGNITEYWTPAEQNTRLIPLKDILLQNRLIWIGIAIVLTAMSYYRFSFTQFLTPFRLFKRKEESSAPATSGYHTLSDIPVVRRAFNRVSSWSQLWYLSKFEFRKIAQSTFFIIIAILMVGLIWLINYFSNNAYESAMQPLTENVIRSVGSYGFLTMIFVVFFSGTVIFREKETRTDELIHATPVSNTVLFFSKYVGLMGIVLLLQLVAVLTGIIIQVSQSFLHIDFMQYMISIVVLGLTSFSITVGICLAIQVFAPNKYLGFFFSLIPLLLLSILFAKLEWNNKLYNFDSDGPRLPYSALNGYGPLFPWFSYKAYWLSFVLIIVFVALYFYGRGKEYKIGARLRFSKKEVTRGMKLALGLSVVSFLAWGSYIYYNTQVLNTYKTVKEITRESVEYEQSFKRYEHTLQPRIVEANVDVDIYPDKGGFHAKGFYWLKNKHQLPVDTVYVNLFDETSPVLYKEVNLNVSSTVIKDDRKFGVKLFKLQQPLQPGDSVKLSFEFDYAPKGFANDDINTLVVSNGSFFNNQMMPSLGYNDASELSSNRERKKYNLPPKMRMARINDSAAHMNTYISNDADWIRFETQVSTSEDQTAIAPGYLVKQWKENGRNFFKYKMDSPMLNFYAYQSARYAIKKDKWNGVNIEIYYNKAHEFNVENMIRSIKDGLSYYTKNFSPYQHRQVRIIEFPRFASFAQSFANTIPFSEDIGFTNKVDTSDWSKIDLPYYVTAHEVAHQWWAHQVIGANVQGSTLLSETMAQYSALMVMEHRYGKDNMKKFLKHEMDNYLRSRTVDGKGERPLMYVENQQYIHYQKGSVIMYALKDYIGEDSLNAALRRFIGQVAYQEPPYTDAVAFVNCLRSATPDSLKYIISDMFEHITVYENYVKSLKSEPMSDGRYKVTLTVGCVKFRSDSMGNNTKQQVNDYIDIGVFAAVAKGSKEQYNPLVFHKVKIDAPEKTFVFIVKEKPVFAGIDPYNKLIDRTPDNNICNFGIVPKVPNLSEKEVRFDMGSDDND
jgi:ABC-2 type transport system permease protein